MPQGEDPVGHSLTMNRLRNITSARLELIAADARMVRADADRRYDLLGRRLGASIPAEWPPELMADALSPTASRLEQDASLVGWLFWYVILRAEGRLIGTVGLKGPPEDGRCDVGYGILDRWQGRGYATEATGALIDWVLTDSRVDRIVAETLPGLGASIKVMEKLGFRFVSDSATGHEGEERVIQYELRRPIPIGPTEPGPVVEPGLRPPPATKKNPN